MLGNYSNQRLTAEESELLSGHPDDYEWYMVYVSVLFKDRRWFQIREDIDLPQDEDDDGVVLMFQNGDVVYFKTLDKKPDDEEVDSIFRVCSFLEDKFSRPISAYVVSPPTTDIKISREYSKGRITIFFSALVEKDGENVVDRLEDKVKNHQTFTVKDSIDHMLLPFMAYQDEKTFKEKYRNYMDYIHTSHGDGIVAESPEKTGANEDEFFYRVMLNVVCHIFSPYEACPDAEFPKKDKLGGIVFRFIGGGATYFKIQNHMPSEAEIASLYELGEFLKKQYGSYVSINAMCHPDIEIRDIKLRDDTDIGMNFVSQRKNDGDAILDGLIEKLENNEKFTIDDHVTRVLVRFMGRRDEDEFLEKYSRFLSLYNESGLENPPLEKLAESRMCYNLIF